MLVTAVEASPLRSLTQARIELGPGIRQPRRPQRRRQDEPARGALLRPHRPLVPDLRPPRPDPLRRLLRSRRSDDSGRRRDRAHPARFGQPDGGPPAPPRRQPCRSRHFQLAAARPWRSSHRTGWRLIKGPPAERRAHLDGFIAARWPSRGPSCASASARRWRSATRWSPGSPLAAATRPSSTPGTRRSPPCAQRADRRPRRCGRRAARAVRRRRRGSWPGRRGRDRVRAAGKRLDR